MTYQSSQWDIVVYCGAVLQGNTFRNVCCVMARSSRTAAAPQYLRKNDAAPRNSGTSFGGIVPRTPQQNIRLQTRRRRIKRCSGVPGTWIRPPIDTSRRQCRTWMRGRLPTLPRSDAAPREREPRTTKQRTTPEVSRKCAAPQSPRPASIHAPTSGLRLDAGRMTRCGYPHSTAPPTD